MEKIGFTSYGVRICVTATDPELLEDIESLLPATLPGNVGAASKSFEPDFEFRIDQLPNGRYRLYKNGKIVPADDKIREHLIDFSLNQLRLTVAENAVDKVFVHAGAVGWRGQGILLPAKSFQGKTTLVAELVKNGATYFSDEYAVLDDEGRLHPFAKPLSLRKPGGDHAQTEIPVSAFGGEAATGALPVGWVIFTEYEKGGRWEAERLSTGRGLLELLRHTLPVRRDPGFAMQVLNKCLNHAIIARSKRGEAAEFARFFLKNLAK